MGIYLLHSQGTRHILQYITANMDVVKCIALLSVEMYIGSGVINFFALGASTKYTFCIITYPSLIRVGHRLLSPTDTIQRVCYVYQ